MSRNFKEVWKYHLLMTAEQSCPARITGTYLMGAPASPEGFITPSPKVGPALSQSSLPFLSQLVVLQNDILHGCIHSTSKFPTKVVWFSHRG